MRVNGTKTVGKLLATNRTYLYSRQLFQQFFHVGKVVFDEETIGKSVLVTVDQSRHAFYSRDLSDTSQNGGRTSSLIHLQKKLKTAASFLRSSWTCVFH